MFGWGKASARRSSARFTPERHPSMTYRAFRRVIDTRSIRRDYLVDDFEYHGTPQIALSRNLKIAVMPNEDRAFYYRDKPFMTMEGYGEFLTIDITRLPRPAYALRAAQQVLNGIPTNITLGVPEGGHCDVALALTKQRFKWSFRDLSLTFHVYEPEPMGPKWRRNFEHDPTRYYTPEEKELWAWSKSQSSTPASVAYVELQCRRAADRALRLQLENNLKELV